MIKYQPCDPKFKSKVGGVRANEPYFVRICGEADFVALVLTKEGEGHQPVHYPMTRVEGGFEVTLNITTAGLYFYYFLVDGVRYGSDELLSLVEGGEDYLQLVYEGEFKKLNGGVIYQIMPDRFNKKGETIKKGAYYQPDWYSMPSHLPDGNGKYNNEYYGGNLKGITEKLDYLAGMGVTYIYLNPIFEAASSHRYDTSDYERIDEGLGLEGDFDELVSEAQKRGIGIILDGVFSHTGSDSKYFNRYGNYDTVGAYQSQSSPYYEWYKFIGHPDTYQSWWGFETLPEVQETSPSYLEYMLSEQGIVAKWEAKGIAGWRLDVADELPDEFLYKLRSRAKGVLIGEVWENAARKHAYGARRRYFLGGQLDGVTNYPIRLAIIEYVKSGNNVALRKTLRQLINDYPPKAFGATMNILGTHDTVRILTALSCDPPLTNKDEKAKHEQSDYDEAIKKLKIASLIQFLLPGVPCVYYGDEAGLTGYEDPFCRKGYPWGRENGELIEHYKRLGEIRSKYSSVFDGFTCDLSPSDEIFVLERGDGTTSLMLTVDFSGRARQKVDGKILMACGSAVLTINSK